MQEILHLVMFQHLSEAPQFLDNGYDDAEDS